MLPSGNIKLICVLMALGCPHSKGFLASGFVRLQHITGIKTHSTSKKTGSPLRTVFLLTLLFYPAFPLRL
jgi:hypothetical protein